ncbi:MAG: hypothetical protein K2O42_01405 [Oscillospiraceae bacterium]|nr:hypothetical protein [Oscillospiraceae bacterium]
MRKMLSIFCMVSLLVCSVSSISVYATDVEESCTKIEEVLSEGLIYSCNLTASNYNGSLCVNSTTNAPYNMKEIGLKNLTVQYSYNGSDWDDEWNAGNFLAYDTSGHTLSNYIISLERSECYYRVTCKHYAKESVFHTQSDSHTSNSVWIPKK